MYSIVLMMAMTTSTESPSFFSLSPTSILILLAGTGGGWDHDLVSSIAPDPYFRAARFL